MKTLLTLAALAALSTPAHALTLEQAMNEVAGMRCSGSSCTSKATGSVTTNSYVSTGSSSQSDKAVASDKCMMGVIGQPGVRVQMPNVDANCTALSIASTGSGYSTSTTSATCTTTTKTMTYNGPFTSRDMAWSVDTSTATVGGGC